MAKRTCTPGFSRTSLRYQRSPRGDDDLGEWLGAISQRYERYGCMKPRTELRRRGLGVNHNRVYRVWRRERLAPREFALLCRHKPTGIDPTGALPPRPLGLPLSGLGRQNEREAEPMPCPPVQPPASALGSLPSVALPSARASTILQEGQTMGHTTPEP